MTRHWTPSPWLWAPAVLAADFLSKRLVLAHSDTLLEKVRVIGDLVRFSYVRNSGAAMGLFHGGRPVLVAVSIVSSFLLVFLYARTAPGHRWRRGALAAILGGALGNLVDRIFYGGAVVDFIDIGIGIHRFYTFNVADMGVTLGGAVLVVGLLAESWRERSAAKLAVETTAPTSLTDAGQMPRPEVGGPAGSSPPPAGAAERLTETSGEARHD